MNFHQDGADPSLWLPDTEYASPGAHGLVIGVSDYPGLDGSDHALGLDSLFTSALTAYTFFEWLTTVYHSAETPLKSCRLLLAPTDAELAVAPSLAAAPRADFASCSDAVKAWFGGLQSLFGPTLESSRAIFFFSGHGLQAATNNQVLLPSNYLEADTDRDAALSTRNLSNGLEPLGLREEFYFLDACRSRVPDEQRMKGARILEEPEAFNVNPERERVLLYATKAGSETWQHPDPATDISVFGRALLEGLTAAPADPFCSPSFLSGDTLYRFVRARTTQLMSDLMNRHVPNAVTRAIEGRDGCFSVVRGFTTPWWRADLGAVGAPSVEGQYRDVLDRADDKRVRFDSGTTFREAHELLGSETLSTIWQRKQLHSLDDPNRLSVLTVEALSVFGDTSFTMEFFVEGPGAWLLELSDDQHHWFTLLPPQAVFKHAYRTFFTRDGEGLSRFGVGLSPQQPDPTLNEIAQVSRLYDLGESRDAFRRLEHDGLQDSASPLSSVLWAAMLLRSPKAYRSRSDELEFALTVPDQLLADRAVLRVEMGRRLRTLAAPAAQPLSDRWSTGIRESLPFLAEVFEMAIDQLDRIEHRASSGDAGAAQVMDDGRVEDFRGLEAAFNPGGLFTSFTTTRDGANRVRDVLLNWRGV